MLYRICNGAVTFGNKTILEEINFEVKNQEHVAVVGRNGCGKTTLLRAIMGEVSLEEGISEGEFSVTSFGKPRIGYIRQGVILDDNATMLDEILEAYQEIKKTERCLQRLSVELETRYSDKLLDEYQDLQFYYQTIGGYSYQKEYELAICKFGFCEEDKSKKLKEFSFGQRTKIAFLKLLLSKPDLLLLDEPTNHLDIVGVEWLEKYLATYPKAMVVVSHDRMFLDAICNVVYEISYGSMKRYVGNYSTYIKQRELDYEKDLRDYERQQKEIERLTKIAERFRYKPTKASMALSKLKQVEKMVKLEKPQIYDMRTFSTNFDPKVESYLEVLKVSNLGIGYREVLGVVNLKLERGARLGIIGENGSGKSTFLKTLVGEIPALSGKFSFGKRVVIGYFDQNIETLNEEDTVLEVMTEEFPMLEVEELRSALGAFEFYGDMVFQKVKSLSGGQRVKLMLLKIMKHQPNVLILDEPTNHLDMIGKETVQRLIAQYKGTVIFVSHDRYLVQKLASCLLVFEKGSVNYYVNGYGEYIEKKEEGIVVSESMGEKSEKPKKYVSSLKEKTKLEKKINKLEMDIQKLEECKKQCQEELLKEEVYLDMVMAKKLENEIFDLDSEILEKMGEWERLLKQLETYDC